MAIDTPDKVLHPKKRAFLAAYAKCGIIGTACRHAEISRPTYYYWTEHDERFSVEAKRAYAEACDYIEEKALERAVIGREVVKEVYEPGADGELVLVKREVSGQVSDTMLAMMLNGAKPEKYKTRVDHSGSIDTAPKLVARELYEAL
jgi:hypothetical protein